MTAPASTGLVDLRRIYHTVPELDRTRERIGVSFVDILFGLVVTQAAILLAPEMVSWIQGDPVNVTRVSHLVVVFTMTVLSWIGYHQSQQYPPFLIKFVNIPLWMFIADVLMVVVYFVALAVAETPDAAGVVREHDALPETLLVLVAFVLYVLWDLLGWRLFSDPEYYKRLQTPRTSPSPFGPRRWVSVVSVGVMVPVVALVAWWRPTDPAAVVVVNVALVVILIAYRLAKQAVDPNLKTRGASART